MIWVVEKGKGAGEGVLCASKLVDGVLAVSIEGLRFVMGDAAAWSAYANAKPLWSDTADGTKRRSSSGAKLGRCHL